MQMHAGTQAEKDSHCSTHFAEDAFSRIDESDDALFYERDRFVTHLDSLALSTVEKIIGKLVVENNPAILDLMASWDSHIPSTVHPSRLVGLGLNRNELSRNDKLSEYVIHDLNSDPSLPFPDGTFDVVVNTVSVDYLVKPFRIFNEVGRVLKPQGLFLVIFSNRMFPEKATRIWRDATEKERVELVASFFEAAGAFETSKVFVSSGRPRPKDDKYAHMGIPSDPVYAVYADKKGVGPGERVRPDLSDLDEARKPAIASCLDLKSIRETLRCPHCGEKMKKWEVPNSPFSDWDTEFMYICVNDECPYLVRGWQTMTNQGNQGMSYRFMFDPVRCSSIPIPIINLNTLKDAVLDD